jgi:hypothetical protein
MFVDWLKFCNKCTWIRICTFMGVGHNRLTARSRVLMANLLNLHDKKVLVHELLVRSRVAEQRMHWVGG